MDQYFVINVLIILFLAFSLFNGYRKGFLFQVLNLLTFLIVFCLAFIFSKEFSKIFNFVDLHPSQKLKLSLSLLEIDKKINIVIWFIILFVVGLIVLGIIKRLFKKLTSNLPIINGIDRTFGMILSLVFALFILFNITTVFNTPLVSNGNLIVEKTILKPINNISKKAADYLVETVYDSGATKILFEKLSGDYTKLKPFFEKYNIVDENSFYKYFGDKSKDIEKITGLSAKDLVNKAYGR